jgi:hypothetical protein
MSETRIGAPEFVSEAERIRHAAGLGRDLSRTSALGQ